ncbi:signal peptidase II [Candidatus Aquiluna sp. UB-MaderosW2red]|uniref:signal peptidase II n=1 Tax=Candidatus Aquiluna sp. UB-MaderosW2red TaxID=1855377 RepID=UPI000875BB44|nr:signal peptidase II [Candidatus Aquiluna sp. UB-MaderosW2red]SCX12545.1 signal peptidase II [Candidatus Aquiluna sp. UB-MaderosW2red]
MSAVSNRRNLFFATAFLVILLDQITKELAIFFLTPGTSVPFIGEIIRFRLVYNDSAAFSLSFGATWILAIISILAVLGLLWYGPKVKTTLWGLIAGFVTGGAAGNGIDRVLREPQLFSGHVVDFIQVPLNFPIFNLADSFLVIGVALMIYRTLRGDQIGGGVGK